MDQNPMNDNLPSNSHKSREEEAMKTDGRPEVKVFEGEVAGAKRKKPNSFLSWMKRMFLSDRKPSEIVMDILENQVVPGMKDNFRNSMVSSIDAFIYQNAKTSGSGSNNISSSKIYSGQNSANTGNTRQQESKEKKDIDLNGGFTNPCFKSKMDATKFLIDMKQYDYPTLSVHTLYMMRKMHIDYTWDAYGWT